MPDRTNRSGKPCLHHAKAKRDPADRGAELAAAEAANAALLHANATLAASRAALESSEAQLRLALDAARMATWDWDTVGDRVVGSAGREALYGRPPGALATRAAVLDAVHPEDRARAAETILRAMARPPGEEEFDAVEFRVTDPDGRVRWLRSQGRVTRRDPETGRALQAAGVTYDITERKEAEAALREAETRQRTLFEAAPFGVIVIDPASHRILDVNDQICADYGYGREELLRMSIGEIDVLGEPGLLRERGRAHAIRPGTQEFEARHRTKSGAVRDVLVRVRGVRLGSREVSYGAHFDITDRKAAEARLALLAREVDHRAKNVLAVVQAALRLTPKTDPREFARAVEGRVMALARAHTLLAAANWSGAPLRAVAEAELAAFLPGRPGARGPLVSIEGPELMLSPAAAQACSMALHELATNATKYGAFSVPGGRAAISWELDLAAGLCRLRWAESGGPPILAPPTRRGFGSRLLAATLHDQLGGQLEQKWERPGLICEIALPLARVQAGGGRLPGG
jgi:PAS domain S-box-containing protein